LRPWPIEISIGGANFTIPALVASDWLWYLMAPVPDLDRLLEDLVPGLEDLLYAEALSVEEFYEAALDVVACASAREWWVALRLIMVARERWDVLGPALIGRNADPNVLSLSGWLDVLLVTILEGMDPEKTTMFLMQLEASPMPKQGGDSIDDMEMDANAFLSLGQGQ
jgi:hypothetical protein